MIGVIDNEISAFCIIEKIRKKYPKANIYLYKKEDKDIEISIEELKKRNCQIIIIPRIENIDSLKEKHPTIFLLTLKTRKEKNSYTIENKPLIEAIEKGNEKEVDNQLKKLMIPKEKIIVLNNPKLLFIKSKIESKFQNEIVDNVEILLKEIESIGISLEKEKEEKIIQG